VNPFQVLASPQATWRVTVATVCGVWIVAALFAVPSARSKYLLHDVIFFGLQAAVIFEFLLSCVLLVCDGLHIHHYRSHLVEFSFSISEKTQNPQEKHAEILQRLWWD
jgi:hypothetical protein